MWWSLGLIFALFVGGLLIGRKVPLSVAKRLSYSLTPLIWGLLFAIGYEFGLIFDKLQNLWGLLGSSVLYVLLMTIFTFLLVHGLYRRYRQQTPVLKEEPPSLHLAQVVLEPLVALVAVAVGGVVARLALHYIPEWAPHFPPSMWFIYALLLVIGIDLAHTKVPLHQLKPALLWLPFWALVASALAGASAALLLGMDWRYGLALTGGFGWYSLSSVMISAHLGEYYGALSLLNELFRELLSIVLLFFWGRRLPHSTIAIAGAPAMDTTLPIIRKTAGTAYVVHGIYVGTVLSMVAPLWLALVLSWTPVVN